MDEAQRTYAEREALKRRDKQIEDDKRVATSNLCRAVSVLHPRGGDPAVHVTKMFDEVDERYWDAPGGFDCETLTECIEVLKIVADKRRK